MTGMSPLAEDADALFDVEPYHVPAQTVEPLSADQRRTERQHEALSAGWHPLAAAGYKIRLHADAPADRLDRDALGVRCGGCRFRVVLGHHSRSYAKCLYPGARPKTGYPRLTHGPGTDIRAWWPACTDYQLKEA